MGVYNRDAPASPIGRRSLLLGIYFVSRLRLVSTQERGNEKMGTRVIVQEAELILPTPAW